LTELAAPAVDREIVSLDEPAWSGQSVCLALSRGNAISLLRQHAQCKDAKPRETCAVVLVPEAVHAQCSPLLAHMHCLGKHQMREDKSYDWVYRDDPAEIPGVHAVDLLPKAIKALRTVKPSEVPELTFVFEGKVAGRTRGRLGDKAGTKKNEFFTCTGTASSSAHGRRGTSPRLHRKGVH
jgi:hypothetical protein